MLKSITEHMREKTVTGASLSQTPSDWRLMVLLSSVFALPNVSF